MRKIGNNIYYTIIGIFTLIIVSCSSDANEVPSTPKSSENQITKFTFLAQPNGLREDIRGTIDATTNEIQILLSDGIDKTVFTPEVLISEKATIISPLSSENLDFSEPVEYIIEAENGTRDTYTVRIESQTSKQAELTDFTIRAIENTMLQTDIRGIINSTDKTVSISLPDVDISSMKVEIVLSEGSTADLNPDQIIDFTKTPLILNVKAEDGVTTTAYTLHVTILEDQSQIKEFQFLASENGALDFDVTGVIKEDAKKIQVSLPQGVVVNDLIPSIVMSNGATFEKIADTSPVQFKVTSADKNTIIFYTLETITVTDRLVLEAIFNANPSANLDWPISDVNSDISGWSGIRVENGRIVEFEKENLTTLPEEIKYLTKLRELNLNYSFLDTLPEELRYLKSLTNISLIANNLETLPEWFAELENLNRIDLSRNKIIVFPEILLSLSQLQHLLIRFNRGLSELPDHMEQLSSILTFDVSGNSIRSIPPGIKGLVKARRINFSRNNLATIPVEITEINGLRQLDLRENRSLRTLPQEVCDLTLNPGFSLLIEAGVCP